jgi:parallel beta-helix repeat protein
MENSLRKNRVGVHVESADPVLFRNEIRNSFDTAVVFTCIEDLGCAGVMSTNTVRESEANGIWVRGQGCKPTIDANPEISLCRLAGIKVSDRAHPTISNNLIKNNLAQGILVVEGASAHILKNEIEENMKANIAFGGMLSGDTIIERNTISRGRSEGIFMIEGEHAIIIRNVIKENMDGMLLSSASPLITQNEIVKNRRCGIIMVSRCNPKVVHNIISENYACGILIRQNSLGFIQKNEVSLG